MKVKKAVKKSAVKTASAKKAAKPAPKKTAKASEKLSLRQKFANYKKDLKQVYDDAWLAGYNACKEDYKFGQASAAAAGIMRGYKDKRKVNKAKQKAIRINAARSKA